MRSILFAAVAAAAAGTAGAAPAESPSHVFEGKDIFSLQCVTDPQIRPDGHVVRAADEVAPGDLLRIRLADGELRAAVRKNR